MSVDKNWLFVRSNMRRLAMSADDAADDDDTPRQLKKDYQELEQIAKEIERTLRRLDY